MQWRLPVLTPAAATYAHSVIGTTRPELDLDSLSPTQLDELLVVIEAEIDHLRSNPPGEQDIEQRLTSLSSFVIELTQRLL